MAPPPNTVIQNQEFHSETLGKNKTCFIHYMVSNNYGLFNKTLLLNCSWNHYEIFKLKNAQLHERIM